MKAQYTFGSYTFKNVAPNLFIISNQGINLFLIFTDGAEIINCFLYIYVYNDTGKIVDFTSINLEPNQFFKTVGDLNSLLMGVFRKFIKLVHQNQTALDKVNKLDLKTEDLDENF